MKLRVLQWNIWYKEEPENILKELKHIDADVVCLQELIWDSRRGLDVASYLAKELGYHYFAKQAETWENIPIKTAQGNGIFSRYPIRETSFVYVRNQNHNASLPWEEGRVYLEANIEAEEKNITIGTTHLSYLPRFEFKEIKQNEVEKLVAILAQKKESYIFTGDLNEVPASPVVEEIQTYLKHAGPDFAQKTWTTKPFEFGDFRETELNWRLDYIFATPDIRVLNSEIVSTPYSDHLPVFVTMEI